MKKLAVLVSMLALFCLCAACDSGDSSSSDGSNTEPNTVTSTVTVTDWVTAEPIEGVTLCIDGRCDGFFHCEEDVIDCADTDAEGVATFNTELLIVGSGILMTGDKDGYFPFLTEIRVSEATANAAAGYIMAPSTIVSVVIEALGEEPDAEKGHLGVVAWGPADADGNRVQMAGATMTLLLGTAIQGPKYYNLLDNIGDGVFAPDEGGTTEAGMAGFFNVDPEIVSVTVTAEGHDCSTVVNGLPGPWTNGDFFGGPDGSVEIDVQAGRISYIVVLCDAE